MEAKYQNEKKQKENLELKNENELQQRTKYLLLLVLGVVVIATCFIYRSNRIKQKLNKELNTVNQKLEEADHSKTKLLSIISHDLRGPVSSLFGFLQLKKESPALSAAYREKHDDQINAAAENVLEAMEDVLIWSKSQMEKFTPSPVKIYLDELLPEIANLHATAAGDKNIRLSIECPAGLTLYADQNFLKIVLRNLVSNAVKFTPKGGKIDVVAERQQEMVCITVKDNGEGIDEEHLPHIFDWNSIRSDSSGLGLKLAKEFTEKLGGTIVVRSVIKEGTKFILSLPSGSAK